MSKIETASAINKIHGKTNGKDSGYFYMRYGKHFYRTREETYQKNRSLQAIFLILFAYMQKKSYLCSRF